MGILRADSRRLSRGSPWVLLLILCGLPLSAAAQPGPALPDGAALPDAIIESEGQLGRLVAHQRLLEGRLSEQSERIARLKRQQPGLQRDARLQVALREAQAIAARLDGLQQGRVKQARASLEQAYRAALARPTKDATLRARLQQRLQRLLADASRPETRIVVGATAGPLDDADDLETKADLLRDSADKVERQLRAVRTQLAALEQRASLQRHQAAANTDLFIEEAPRWVAQARSSVSAVSAADSSDQQAIGDPREAITNGTAPSSGTAPAPRGPLSSTTDFPISAAGGAAPSDARSGVASPGNAGSSAASPALSGSGLTTTTTTVTLASVLDPGTVRALQQAARSGNPSAHAAALKQAAERLEQLARRLSAQAQGLRRDAVRERAQH